MSYSLPSLSILKNPQSVSFPKWRSRARIDRNSSGEHIFPRLEAVLGKQALGLGKVYPATT